MRRMFPILLLFAPSIGAQEAPSELPTVAQLIEQLRQREGQATAIELETKTSGLMPNGEPHSMTGRVRVLGKTHRHTSVKGSFGSSMTFENETVTTPEGTWMRQKDPMEGEVFLKMEPALQKQLADASAVLSGGEAKDDPLAMAGAKMLEDMQRAFDLSVTTTRLDGREYLALKGPARAQEPDPQGDAPPAAPPLGDEVEILLDRRELTLKRMVMFEQGKPKDTIEIVSLVLNPQPEPDPRSFRIELPPGKTWVDVMSHPSSRASIEAVLADAKERQQAEPPKEKREETGKESGR